MAYYLMEMDNSAWPFWFLGAPMTDDGVKLDARIFTECCPYHDAWPLTVPVRNQGPSLDFSFAVDDMPIVSESLGAALEGVCGQDIERIPVSIEGGEGRYEILNILNSKPCLDEEASIVTYWTPQDGRTDKIGTYRMVANIRICSDGLEENSIFRLAGWPLAIVVSESVKRVIEIDRFSGVVFKQVSRSEQT